MTSRSIFYILVCLQEQEKDTFRLTEINILEIASQNTEQEKDTFRLTEINIFRSGKPKYLLAVYSVQGQVNPHISLTSRSIFQILLCVWQSLVPRTGEIHLDKLKS